MFNSLFSKLLGFVLLLGAVAFAGYAYYIKYPPFHDWVDTTFPQIKTEGARVLSQISYNPNSAASPSASPGESASTDGTSAAPAASAASAVPAPGLAPAGVDLAQLSQSRAQWPKSLVLKKEIEFPAVLDGKIVGSVKAPPGAQVHLMLIKDGKLGLEFQGGGAMVDPADTNLIEQVLASRQTGGR